MRIISKTLAIIAIMIVCDISFVQAKGYEKSIELHAGFPIANEYSKFGIGITMMNGYRFNDIFYLGAGVGYEYFNALYETIGEFGKGGEYIISDKNYRGKNLIRLFGRIKVNFTKKPISPYFAGDIGYAFDLNANKESSTSGILLEPQFGLDLRLREDNVLYIAVGLRMQENSHLGYPPEHFFPGINKTAAQIGIKCGIVF